VQRPQFRLAERSTPAAVDALFEDVEVQPTDDEIGDARVDLMLIEHEPQLVDRAEDRRDRVPEGLMHRRLGGEPGSVGTKQTAII